MILGILSPSSTCDDDGIGTEIEPIRLWCVEEVVCMGPNFPQRHLQISDGAYSGNGKSKCQSLLFLLEYIPKTGLHYIIT